LGRLRVSNTENEDPVDAPNVYPVAFDSEPAAMPSFSVGATLREGRERMGKDLSQVATTLRIRQPFLAALEEGRFKDLPGGTYAIGFLRTYSEFLGLDGEEMVRRFRQEAADALTVHAELQFPSPVSEGRMPSAPILLIGLAIAVVAYGMWWGIVYNRDIVADLIPVVPDRLVAMLKQPAGMGANPPATQTQPQTQSVPETQVAVQAAGSQPTAGVAAPTGSSAVDGAAPVPPGTPSVGEEAKAASDVVPPAEEDEAHGIGGQKPPSDSSASSADTSASSASGRVVVKALSDECWIQVRESDGQLVVSRLLRQGDTYQVPDRPGLTLTAGNAGSLQIIVDGSIVPSLGSAKQVKHDISLDPAKLLKKVKAETESVAPEKTEQTPPVQTEQTNPEPKKAEKKAKSSKSVKSKTDAPSGTTAPDAAAQPVPPAALN